MNLIVKHLISISLIQLCLAQDYATPTYNPENQVNPTNDYLNTNDPKYDNPYDPNRRFSNRNQHDVNQYDPSRNSYNTDQRYNQYDNRNEPGYVNQYGSENTDNTPRPSWGGGRTYGTSYKTAELEHDSVIINEATYFIVASRMVRPGQIYKISANILRARLQMTIRASISCNGVEIADVIEKVKEGVPEVLNMRVPATSVPGDYKLRVEGLFLDDPFGGRAFVNETQLTFSKRFMTIFIQMDKPVYMQTQTVKFRVIPINTELKAFGRAIDVYILDPNRRVMKRWLSRQSNFGTVSLQYPLSDQPLFGEWLVRVEALGQVEEAHFLVEEYYQTRFEVNVTMPAFFFNTDQYIHGRIMANYTSGAPVRGNLTLRATLRPIPQYRPRHYQQGQFNNRGPYGSILTDQYTRVRPNYNPYLYNESGHPAYEYTGAVDEYGRPSGYRPGQPNQLDQPDWWYDPQKVYTRMFNFDEKYPFWMPKPDPIEFANQQNQLNQQDQQNQQNNPNYQQNNNNNYQQNNNNYNMYSTSTTYNYYNNPYYDQLPYLRFFNGTYDFKYPMSELAQLVPVLDGIEVIITASVGDPFLDEVIEGYSIARIFNSSLAVHFLGGELQVFKPAMPFDVYMVVSYHDGSRLPAWQAAGVALTVTGQLEGRGGALEPQRPSLVPGHDAVWHLKLDLYKLLKLENDPNYREVLNSITGLRLSATLGDALGGRAVADVHLVAHESPNHHHLRVSTSTTDARVGEYVVFHVQSNFYMESFNYVVMSKGIILTSGQEIMQEGVRTFSAVVSAEMAPVATLLVWAHRRRAHVLADSLTFPVNGVSTNNFTVHVNNRKHRTGERVEVAIYGEPGAYVGLSAIDHAFYTMQAGNELTYAKVISKMSHFDESTNGTFSYTWRSHFGDADELVYFPSPSFGIDANRTFEYAGLIVLSDVAVYRRYSMCNESYGLAECLDGTCYPADKRCDGAPDCSDRTDESNCKHDDSFELAHFRKFRFNRIQRQYDNVWMWRDVNIGPHGRYVFTLDVPAAPAHWTISAVGMSPGAGLGMLSRPLNYVGILPFFIKVEGPDRCRQGEQLGLRVAVFNYQPQAIEAVVVLASSPDYKFVHVEENGIVRSYNPRTSFGEHQFFVYILAGDAAVVHIPVVPARLGRIRVDIVASTLQGQHRASKHIEVEADGIPQYRHQSVLLDLSNRAYVFQYMHVNVTETPIIPYEVDRYYVFGSNKARLSIVGDVVGPLFPTMPVNATSLLDLPMDSAEQNMFSFAANMYLTLYMRLINQRNRTLEHDAFYHMNVLYQRQLSYMKPDGSFSLFRSDWNQSSSSVWLTSFCAKIFQDASFNEWENYIYIDPNVISMAVSWVLEHQRPEGSFYEVTWSPDRNANDTIAVPMDSQLYRDASSQLQGVQVNNTLILERNITLTAQVVITLESVKNLKDIGLLEGLSARVATAQQRGVSWLERHLQLLHEFGEPLALALVTHALGAAKAPSAETAFRLLKRHQRSEGGLVYWGKRPVPPPPYKMENQKPFLLPRLPYRYDSNNVAATAYALLACMDHQDNNEQIVMWLNTQRLKDGGWASTQDTYIALRALIEYTNRKRLRDVSALAVSVDAVALRGATRQLRVRNDNLATMQSIDIPEAWGTVKVTARGAGYAILQMSVQYNVDIDRFQTAPPARCFDLLASAYYHGRNQSHIRYQTCASWTLTEESPRSGLAVLEVGIPTGYMIQQQRLDSYVLSRAVRTLQRAKYQPDKLLFYFDYLDRERTCVNFTIERWYPVANMSRYLPIRVYDYYAPERFNETIFDALPTYLLNICEVCGSSQCPYCAIYNAAARLQIPLLLLAATCVALVRNVRNYDT